VSGLRHELLLGHVRQAGCAGVALLTRSTDRLKDTQKGPPVGWVRPGERGHANLLACLFLRLVDLFRSVDPLKGILTASRRSS